jgi:hypothetical protein
MEFKFHRAPAIARKIANITPEKDIRVRILGKVLDKTENTIILKDSSAEAEIILEPEFAACIATNETIRIFARVLPLENGFELRSELIQDMSKMNEKLYESVILDS